MDFQVPEELAIQSRQMRRLIEKDMTRVERETCDGEELKPEWRPTFEMRAKELGIWMMDVPKQYGGLGMLLMASVIVWEELARKIALPSYGNGITGTSVREILYDLDVDMKERYLHPVLRGEKKTCFAQTEPDAGSDPGLMRTTAVHHGDHYLVNGVTRFITGAEKTDFI